MKIKLELLINELTDIIKRNLSEIDIDANAISNTAAISALEEIKNCVNNNNLSDFEIVEEIVEIFKKYNINSGNRHDF